MTATASLAHPPASAPDLALIVQFVHAELDLLDQREFERWAALFTEDGFYWAPVSPDQASPRDHVSLFYDDVKTMAQRIQRLRHPRIHMQTPPSQTVHLVSNFRGLQQGPDDTVCVRCNFVLFEYRPSRSQIVYGGTYDYALVVEGGGFRMRSKKATLVNAQDAFPSLAVWF